jgi:hypothetical protein
VWNNLAAACADLEALGAFAELRRAYKDDLIAMGLGPNELDDVENGPRGKSLTRFRERHPRITDVAHETGWWQCFQNDPVLKAEQNAPKASWKIFAGAAVLEPQPPCAPKVGRNDRVPAAAEEIQEVLREMTEETA